MKTIGALSCPCMCLLFSLLPLIFVVIVNWRVFEKAGQPGWAALVPFYNGYVLTVHIAKKDLLWFILLLIPGIQIVAAFVICIEVARKFGQSEAFGVGMVLLSFIFFPILAFGDAKYEDRSRPRPSFDDDYERPKHRRRDEEYDDDDDYRRRRRRDRDDDDDDRPRRRR